jgi:hypothetical protein
MKMFSKWTLLQRRSQLSGPLHAIIDSSARA